MTIEAKGRCLCGAVKIEAKTLASSMGACHCSMCRNWSAGPFFAVDGQQAVIIVGEDKVSRYDSSEWAERAFFSACGTHLFYRLTQTDVTFSNVLVARFTPSSTASSKLLDDVAIISVTLPTDMIFSLLLLNGLGH